MNNINKIIILAVMFCNWYLYLRVYIYKTRSALTFQNNHLKTGKMERLTRVMIGSSNVNRFYKKEEFSGFKECKMVKCCNEEVFKVRLDDLVVEEKEVIISVIENFITDAVGKVKDEKVTATKIDETIKRFLTMIEETAVKLPGTKFAISLPVRRPLKTWYTTELDRITKIYGDGICKIGRDNVAWIQVPANYLTF